VDNIWVLVIATMIEGTCAAKIARKFNDLTPPWKFYVPILNIITYGKFSLSPRYYIFTLALIQGVDMMLSLTLDVHSQLSSLQILISISSFLMWAVMVARIAVRLGQGFWSYLAAAVLSMVAGNFVIIALLYMFDPAFSGEISSIPLWAEVIAIVIPSLPFLSLAFDKKAQS